MSFNFERDDIRPLQIRRVHFEPKVDDNNQPVSPRQWDVVTYPEFGDKTDDHNIGDSLNGEHAKGQKMSLASFNSLLEYNGQPPLDGELVNAFMDSNLQVHPELKNADFPVENIGGHKELSFRAPIDDTIAFDDNPTRRVDFTRMTRKDNTKQSFVFRANQRLTGQAAARADERDKNNFNSNYASNRGQVEGYVTDAHVAFNHDQSGLVVKLGARQRRDVNPFNSKAGNVLKQPKFQSADPNVHTNEDLGENTISLNQFNRLLLNNHHATISDEQAYACLKNDVPLASASDNLAFRAPSSNNKINFARLSRSNQPFDYNNIEKFVNKSARHLTQDERIMRDTKPRDFKKFMQKPTSIGATYKPNMYSQLNPQYRKSKSFRESAANVFSHLGDAFTKFNDVRLKHKSKVLQRRAKRRAFYQQMRVDPVGAMGALTGHCLVSTFKHFKTGAKLLGRVAEHRMNQAAVRQDFKTLDAHGNPSGAHRMDRFQELSKRAIKNNDFKALKRAERFYDRSSLDSAMEQSNIDPEARYKTLMYHYANRGDLSNDPYDVQLAKNFMNHKDQIIGAEQSPDARDQMRANTKFYDLYPELNETTNEAPSSEKQARIDEIKAKAQKSAPEQQEADNQVDKKPESTRNSADSDNSKSNEQTIKSAEDPVKSVANDETTKSSDDAEHSNTAKSATSAAQVDETKSSESSKPDSSAQAIIDSLDKQFTRVAKESKLNAPSSNNRDNVISFDKFKQIRQSKLQHDLDDSVKSNHNHKSNQPHKPKGPNNDGPSK